MIKTQLRSNQRQDTEEARFCGYMYCLHHCMFLILVRGSFLWVHKVCFGYWYSASHIRYTHNNKKNIKIECNIKIKEIYLGVKNTTTELFALEIMNICDRVYIKIEMHNVKGN